MCSLCYGIHTLTPSQIPLTKVLTRRPEPVGTFIMREVESISLEMHDEDDDYDDINDDYDEDRSHNNHSSGRSRNICDNNDDDISTVFE